MTKAFLPIKHSAKTKGIILVVLVICYRIWLFLSENTYNTSASTVGAVFGLFFIFFSHEKVEKEEYQMLRYQALSIALLFYFAGIIFFRFFFTFIEGKTDNVPFLSPYDLLIIVLTLAIGIFYYLKAKSIKESGNK